MTTLYLIAQQIDSDAASAVPTRELEVAAGRRRVRPIVKQVSRVLHVPVGQILNKRYRSRSIAEARQVAFYVMRQRTRLSLEEIGRAFGNFDHTTVIHACRVIPKRTQTDAGLAVAVNLIFAHCESEGL